MSKSNARIFLVLGVLFIVACGPRQPTSGRDYDIYHYGNSKHLSPAHVATLDNNYEILAACREPSSRASLLQREGHVTESQIELLREFGFRDESQALVVAYHEMKWDLADHLVRDGTITRPTLLADPRAAEQEHVENLVFVVRKSE